MRFGGGIDGGSFNPRSVSLGQQWATNRMPYIAPNGIDQALPTPFVRGTHTPPKAINFDGGPVPAPSPVKMSGAPAMAQFHDPEDQGLPPNVLGAEAVRATGTGPYDAAYRQNLATYAGGQFVRPAGPGFLGGNTSGSVLSFNPTGGLFGNPTGGGNAPVLGMPNSLIGQALSGNPFSFTPLPPPPPPPPSDDSQWTNPLGFWRDQFLDDGRQFGGGMRMMELE
jgi:hypothetical protein